MFLFLFFKFYMYYFIADKIEHIPTHIANLL